jgi:hypothetical protein
MLKPITRQYKDLSTADRFSFAFCCDRCGKEWRGDTYTFDLKGFELPIDEKIRSMLWNQQHEEVYERANREAGAIFSRCPDCGCRICDDCLIQAELEKNGKCRDCADKNH